ncbi:MAG TPA: hypothetical protein PLP19_19400 [bacterium]|nr:hypothetical protein [bacterium]HPN45663.1 hypothetical protein [bacterium]
MKTNFILACLLLCTVFLLVYCHEQYQPVSVGQWEPPQPVRYLSFTHYPWNTEVPALGKSLAHGVQLENFQLEKDTLTLRLQLYARVSAQFIDSVAIKDNCLTLILADTVLGARYYNYSQGDFKFLYPYGKSAVRVIFKWRNYPDYTFKTPLDTIIQIY